MRSTCSALTESLLPPGRSLAVIALCLISTVCLASSVWQIGIEKVISASEFVFEGQVIKSEVRAAGEHNNFPFTYVTFEIIEAIEGDYPGETIELGFLGGTLSGRTLAIPDMHLPQVGEHGIYFVETLSQQQVHPLYGWDQGHYVVKPDLRDGNLKVYTRALNPVIGIKPSDPLGPRGLSTGYAAGLKVQPKAEAISVDEFKAELRKLMEAAP